MAKAKRKSKTTQVDDINPEWVSFPTLGYLIAKLTKQQLEPIWKEVREILEEQVPLDEANQPSLMRNRLAGNIRQQHQLSKCHAALANITMQMVGRYEQICHESRVRSPMHRGVRAASIHGDFAVGLIDSWVNFQKKHEFNPLHDHSGLYSFVLYLQVPYDIKDEMESDLARFSNTKSAGHFAFVALDNFGTIGHAEIPIDRSWEGTIILFPALVNHTVYPFQTSDDYRISVSGNIGFCTPLEILDKNQQIHDKNGPMKIVDPGPQPRVEFNLTKVDKQESE